MKNVFSAIIILFTGFIYAQELIVHELDAPNATYYEDLEVLRPLY